LVPEKVRPFLGNLSFVSRRKLARRLIARADAARDARRFDAAAVLYAEALNLGWSNPHIRVQCGNMLKDSGQFPEAEQHYLRALQELPDDPDIWLQMGHLYKLAGDLAQAEARYRRALELKPGWADPQKELATLADERNPAEGGRPRRSARVPSDIIMELLPREVVAATDPNEFRLMLFGREPKGRRGSFKQLRGVEAIRGFRKAPTRLHEVRLLIDGECVRREGLVAYPREDEQAIKHVFNLWHDFSDVPVGPHMIELQLYDTAGKLAHRHRERMEVAPPLDEESAGSSDAWVPSPGSNVELEDAINALPSLVRTPRRALLPDPVRTILVQRTDQLGDLALSAPAIRRLRTLFPEAKLIGLVTPANAGLAEALGLFDGLVTVDFAEDPALGRRVLTAEAQRKLRRALAPYAFDVAIDLGEGDDSRPLLLLSGARFRYGFRHRHFRFLHAGLDFSGYDPVNGNDVLPPSRKFTLLVEGLSALKGDEPQPVPNRDRTVLASLGIASDRPFALIHTGARLFFSRWPHFHSLGQRLLEQTDLDLVVIGEQASFADGFPATVQPRLHVIPGMLPFPQLDALIGNCAVFIGNDSGPKHLAALRGVPVVSVHIPRNNWSEWGQEGSGLIVTRRVPCAGCSIPPDGENCGKNFACIRQVTVDEVFAAVGRALEEPN
jgi:ADP-heptose:LPS heptosyltransferase